MVKRFREGEHECSIPFNSIRKRATSVIRPYKKCDYVRVIVKGAPEYVLPLCTSTFTQDGEIRTLGLGETERILDQEIIDPFAKKGLRTLVYAYKDIDSDLWETK